MKSPNKFTIFQGFGLTKDEMDILQDLKMGACATANDKIIIVVDEYDTVDVVRIHKKVNKNTK